MTRDELSRLYIDLVELILRLQAEVAGLQRRVADTDQRARVVPRASHQAAPSQALTSPDVAAPVLVRRPHRLRPWYRRLWRSVRPQNPQVGATVLLIAAIVIALSVVVGMALTWVLTASRFR